MLCTISIIALGLVIYAAYKFFSRPHTYWLHKGVEQGNTAELYGRDRKKISTAEHAQQQYNIAPNARYCGVYSFGSPALLLRDPDLIKQITIKDFDHFSDHKSAIPLDSLFSKNLFVLTGQNWKDMRSTVSPAFTSSKMKYMFALMKQSGEQFVGHFLKQNKDLIELEMKDTYSRFATDTIANIAFGIECNSLEQPDNEFYLMGREVTNFGTFAKTMKMFTHILFPKIYKLLGLKFFPDNIQTFFYTLISDNIKSRQKHGIVRPDMINILMEARKNGLQYEENSQIPDSGFATVQESDVGRKNKNINVEITDKDITCQAMMFFFGGLDAGSSLMCFTSYELAIHPEIQEKLIREIDETRTKSNGEITYESLMTMKYMDMVISEALRKWPNAAAIDRVCTKPYTIEPKSPNEKPLHLKKNDSIVLPIYGLHKDPNYFPDPDRFDPERFNDHNKLKIKPYTYIPFGSGPRNCIGSRFALLETKMLFFYLLSNFEIVPIEKTQIPLKLCKKSFSLIAEGGFWLGLKRRKN